MKTLQTMMCDYCGSYEVECRDDEFYCLTCDKEIPKPGPAKQGHEVHHEVFPHVVAEDEQGLS